MLNGTINSKTGTQCKMVKVESIGVLKAKPLFKKNNSTSPRKITL